MNINFELLKNDFKRNRAGNLALLLFMIFAAGLVVIASIVVTLLFTSMSEMYKTAKPPHFLQMHKGEIDPKEIDEFVSSYEGATAWQASGMIDVYGDDLRVLGDEEFSLADCRLDISLVKQNQEYDLLLDENRHVIHMKKGEIGIPIILLDAYNIKHGDTVALSRDGITREFKVTAFIRDAQMNSTLCASTRMLISDEDFNELFGVVGEKEYLIEVYFNDSSMAADFQTAYENAGLPQNDQAVTYTAIILLSALRDIVMAMILILVSILLVIVALMCMKYTIMAALEEELGEIGTMKAIGLSYQDIRNLYLEKYNLMLIAGITIGFIQALALSKVFTGHVSNTFGRQPFTFLTISIPIISCILVYLITKQYCKKLLKKLKKVTVVDALVNRKGFGKRETVRDGLYRSKSIPVNLLLSVREILYHFSGFIIVFVVMFIVSGIMIVPMNLLNTMKSTEFITYMGSSLEDILIEIDSGIMINQKYELVLKLLKADPDIQEYKELRRVRIEARNTDGEWGNLSIDSGNTAGKELKYLEGKAPSKDSEIALSKLNADEFGKITGDELILRYQNKEERFIISGVYQDVTSGGYTAKATNSFPGVEARKYQFAIHLKADIRSAEKARQWSARIGGGIDIDPMEEFISQTLGGVTRQVEIATIAVVSIGMLLAMLIVVLYMKLRLAKDVAQIAAMKAVGFSNFDVRRQYLYKIGISSLVGIISGTLISNIVGENFISMVFAMMGLGISSITFIVNPWTAYIGIPLVLLFITIGMTWISTRQIREYNITYLMNE